MTSNAALIACQIRKLEQYQLPRIIYGLYCILAPNFQPSYLDRLLQQQTPFIRHLTPRNHESHHRRAGHAGLGISCTFPQQPDPGRDRRCRSLCHRARRAPLEPPVRAPRRLLPGRHARHQDQEGCQGQHDGGLAGHIGRRRAQDTHTRFVKPLRFSQPALGAMQARKHWTNPRNRPET